MVEKGLYSIHELPLVEVELIGESVCFGSILLLKACSKTLKKLTMKNCINNDLLLLDFSTLTLLSLEELTLEIQKKERINDTHYGCKFISSVDMPLLKKLTLI